MIGDKKRRLRYTPKESMELEEVGGYVVGTPAFMRSFRLRIPAALTDTLPLSTFIF
jgi:hypothetical protein